MGSKRRRWTEGPGASQGIRPLQLLHLDWANGYWATASRGWPMRVRGHFPFVSQKPAASDRRGDELTSEETLGRGSLKGQVGGRCPAKC